jgi:DNA polymerase-3 subunit epsilon
MSWTQILRAGWDTETTGTNVETDRIVTAALIVRDGNETVETVSWVINPGVEVPVEASDIHGWTTERIQAEGADPKIALEDLASRLAVVLGERMPLVAFNTCYDWTILDRDLRRNGLPVMADRLAGAPLTLIDPYVLDKQFDKWRKGLRKPKPTCEVYGVALAEWHQAEADALAALLLAEKITERYPRLAEMGPAELFEAQQRWRSTWAVEFQAYKRRSDPSAVVEGAWPLVPFGGAS